MSKTKPSAYGTWHVTTEGDCEGRTTRNLGVHTGYLDDIAFRLAGHAYYALQFEQVDPDKLALAEKTGVAVNVSLGINTGTWDMKGDTERVEYFKSLLAGRDVLVLPGESYASVKLVDGKSEEAHKRAAQLVLANQAKAKLTEEEFAALAKELTK